MNKLSWRDVLTTKAFLGHIRVLADLANQLGFEYFLWNDRVFKKVNDTWEETEFTKDDIA